MCSEQRRVELAGSGKLSMQYWSSCACIRDAIAQSIADNKRIAAYTERERNERLSRELGLFRIQHMADRPFDRSRLAEGDYHPLDIAADWLSSIADKSNGEYHEGPPIAIYLYSEFPGRGKTHLAAMLALKAYASSRLTSFIEETSYLSDYWASDFAERARLQSLVGDQCWLTVIDDLGKSPPNNPTRKSGAQTAWYDIVNRRYLKRGWTIITSNSTLEQLAEQGTINDATYSRLAQMTRRTMIEFIGADYRLIDV